MDEQRVCTVLSGEVPAVPVVVALAAVVFGVLLWRLHRRGELSLLRALTIAFVCVYGAGVVANTVFPIFLDKAGGAQPWSSSINLTPFIDYELGDAIENVVVFLPLGVFLPVIARTRSLWRVVVLGMLFSLLIETVQLFSSHFLNGGHIADINDLLFNTLGAAVGYGLYMLMARIPALADLLQLMSWSRAPAE